MGRLRKGLLSALECHCLSFCPLQPGSFNRPTFSLLLQDLILELFTTTERLSVPTRKVPFLLRDFWIKIQVSRRDLKASSFLLPGLRSGQYELHEVQQGQMQDPAYLQWFSLFPGFLPLNVTSVVLCLQRKSAASVAGCRLTSSTATSSGPEALQVLGNFSHNIPKPALDGDARPPTTRARVSERQDTVWYNLPPVEIQSHGSHRCFFQEIYNLSKLEKTLKD